MERSRVTDAAFNAATVVAVWVLYSTVRSVTEGGASVARENAELVRTIQEQLGLAIEPGLQQALLTEFVATMANTYYLIHFPATAALFVWTFFRSRDHVFPILRDALVAMTLVGLVVHVLFPLAPPRMLDGMIDASILYGPNPYDLPGSQAANQLAAMPSMHVAWAIALAWTVSLTTTRSSLRTLGMLHPALTFFVVIITGHHFVADAIIGSIVAVAALGIVTFIRRPDVEEIPNDTKAVHTLSTG